MVNFKISLTSLALVKMSNTHVADELIGSDKPLSSDGGQSIYLVLSHFSCENPAWRTVA